NSNDFGLNPLRGTLIGQADPGFHSGRADGALLELHERSRHAEIPQPRGDGPEMLTLPPAKADTVPPPFPLKCRSFLNHGRSFFTLADASRPGHSSSLPWGCVGKQLLESGDLRGHAGAGIVLGQEFRQTFLEKALPRLVFKAGVDRVEEDPVRFGGLKVTRGVTDHQDLVRFIAAHRAES